MQEMSASMSADHVLLLAVILLAPGVLCSWLARKLGLPDLVLYLVVGILLGPQVGGYLNVPADSTFQQLLLSFGASYILFDGGTGVRLEVLKGIWITVVTISTVGVLVTALVMCVASHFLLALPWAAALLLGSVISSTDPAALIPILKRIHIRDRLAQLIICEAAFNDAVSAVLTFSLIGAVGIGLTPFGLLGGFVTQAGIGLLIGLLLGVAAAFLMGHERYGFLKDHGPLVTLIVVIGCYLGADDLGASGFMAVFVAGVILGNRHIFGFKLAPGEGRRLHEYADTTAMILRLLIFTLLGAQMDLHLLTRGIWEIVGCILIFTLLARPLTVVVSALPDLRARWSTREMLFICWTRETGVIPGALVGMLLAQRVQYGEQVAAVTFAAILATLLLQGSSAAWVAKRLDLIESQQT